MNFDEIEINKPLFIQIPLVNPNVDNMQPARIIVEEVSIYSLFKEIEEGDKIVFEELVRNLKKDNEKMKHTKNDKIVDKPNKSLLEISQDITIDKLLKVSVKIDNVENLKIEINNILKIKSFEVFNNLKTIQKISEINIVENSHWFNDEILSKKLMMNMLYDAILNQLIRCSKYKIDESTCLYYALEKLPNDNQSFLLTFWTILKKLCDFKLSINDIKFF